jgi:hypothetical protein
MASMVSRRAGRTFSDLACGTGGGPKPPLARRTSRNPCAITPARCALSAEQQRRPRCPVRAGHRRPAPPVPLQPQARLGDPRPVRPAVPGSPPGLRRRRRPPRSPLVPGEPHHGQPLMHDVGPHLALGPVHPLLDLVQERVDHLRPSRRLAHGPAQIPGQRIPAHRLRICLAQRRRRMRDAGRIERFENFHDLPVRLLHRSLRASGWVWSSQPPSQLPEGPQVLDRHVTVLSG